jgi:hypothetical protein
MAAPVQEDGAIELPSQELRTYQTLLRSCGTMALYSITATLDRLRQQGHTGGVDWDKVPRSPVDQAEPWMTEAAKADVGGIAKVAPRALKYLISNPASLPGKIPELLNIAGLVQRKDKSKALKHHYSLGKNTPYGKLSDNLIR